MSNTFVIFTCASAWLVVKAEGAQSQIVRVECDPNTLLTAPPSSAVAKAMRQMGYTGQGTMLALPSEICLCAEVEDHGLRQGSREEGLRFRLEERLPLALEELTADFIQGQGKTLGIAVAIAAIEPSIESLEAQGIAIACVCPTALLVADEWLQEHTVDVVLCASGDHLDCMVIRDRRACSWSMLPPRPEPLELHLRMLLENETASVDVACIGISPHILERLNIPGINFLEPPKDTSLELAVAASQRCLENGSAPVQLRRGRLAVRDPFRQIRTPLRAVIMTAIVLALCAAASMLIAAGKYSRLAGQARLRQEQAFHQALPHQIPPPSITSRLISEEKRLRGLSGTGSYLPPSMSVLPLLRDTLAGLPPNLRFRVTELRLEPTRLYLEGQTLNHGDADLIAAALRQNTGLSVDPPHTEQPTGEDVTFTISASATQTPSPAHAVVASSSGGKNP